MQKTLAYVTVAAVLWELNGIPLKEAERMGKKGFLSGQHVSPFLPARGMSFGL